MEYKFIGTLLEVMELFKLHVYVPLRFKYGISSSQAQFFVFIISALMHEYIVAVPTHIIKFWSFWAILLQFPLNLVYKRYPHTSFGNYFSGLCSVLLGNQFYVCCIIKQVWKRVLQILLSLDCMKLLHSTIGKNSLIK